MYQVQRTDERAAHVALRERVLDILTPHVMTYVLDAWNENPSIDAVSIEEYPRQVVTHPPDGVTIIEAQRIGDRLHDMHLMLRIGNKTCLIKEDIALQLGECLGIDVP